MTKSRVQIERLASALAASGGLKLWSVIVTVLGDLSVHKTKEISGLALTRIVERIGLQPQAMRVALHRLKRDGWIDSRREGRVVFYRLSDVGLGRTLDVRDRVYGSSPDLPEGTVLAILPTNESRALADLPDQVHALPIAARVAFVGADANDLPDDWLVLPFSNASIPGWVRSELEVAACEDEFSQFRLVLGDLDPADKDDPFDLFVLRTLVLHGWRRLVLRADPLAEVVLGSQSQAEQCRLEVRRLLGGLEYPSDLALA